MKKFGLALLITLTLVGFAFPPPSVLAVDKPYLHVKSFTGLPYPDDTQDAIVAEYTGSNNGISLGVQQICDGANCWKTDYYIQARFDVAWTSTVPTTATFWVNFHGTVDHISTFACGTGTSGSCSYYGHYMVPASEITSTVSATHISFDANVEGVTVLGGLKSWSDVEITVDTTPINQTDCDEDYVITSLVSSGTIDATDEDGVSETLVVGQEYRLRVNGGPWNDGTNDRYDAALDLGTGWSALNSIAADDTIVDCVQNGEDINDITIFWEATDTGFAIRVNDVAAAFANNTGGLDYALYTVETSSAVGCSGQFLNGTLLGTINVVSSNATGYSLTMPPLSRALKAGEWINIQVYSGSWTEAGGAAQTDLEINSAGGIYWPMESWFWHGCSENDNNYVQVYDNSTLRIRADDTDANWTNNAGTMVVRIYAVTYDRFPTGCELTYTIGDEIESKIVSASSSTGIRMLSNTYWDPSPWAKGGEGIRESNMRYFVIDTTGGPFWDGQDMSVIPELSVDGGVTWYLAIGSVPGVVCVIDTDEIGHMRIILEETVEPEIQFRVHDPGDGYANNTGTLGYTLYEARGLQIYQPGTALQPGTCDDEYYYDAETAVLLTLQGTSSLGYPLPLIEAGNIYALETSAGPWVDLSTGKYTIALSDDNGITWTELSNYDYLLCGQSDDGDHVLAYIRAEEGRDYRVRVNDGDSNFANNSDNIDLTVYEAETYIDPWHSCADEYTLTELDVPFDQTRIAAYLENGGGLPDMQAGQIYAVEASITAWIDAISNEYFLTDISADDGSTWVAMSTADEGGAPMAECVVQVGSASSEIYRVYFTANGGGYRLRSSGDGETNFLLRGAYVTYRLYSAVNTDPTPEPGDTGNTLPPLWASACYEPCLRPNSLITTEVIDFGTLGDVSFPVPNVGGWLEYGRCGIQKYMAWCPEHTMAIVGLMDDFNDRDPFGTFAEVRDGFVSLQEQLASLSAGGEEVDTYRPYSVIYDTGGGEEGSSIWEGVVPILPETSIWTGGEIDLAASGGEPVDNTAYLAACEAAFEPYTGEMVNGFCPLLALARNFTAVWVGMQLLLDIGMIVVLIKYVKRAWIDKGVAG